ncbi:MAG: STN domain-containing protein [Opitutaceae bacterium]|nr:STN domain-containing protein [Opitutaceae bacterium]
MYSLLAARCVALLRKAVPLLVGAACLCWGAAAGRGEPAKCVFNVPAGEAERTLKTFSEQCGRSLIVATDVTRGIRTNAVQGEWTPAEALNQMLAGTGLVATEDKKSGAFSVRRQKDSPKSQGATAPLSTATDRELTLPPMPAKRSFRSAFSPIVAKL